MARISDISGEVLAGDSGARVVVTYMDGRPPVAMDVSDREAAEILAGRSAPAKSGGRLDEVRRTYPQAYARWTLEDEARLRELFAAGMTPEAIAAQTGRQIGGIRSRLKKLGMIPPAG